METCRICSKAIDKVAQGRPMCLQAVAATALLEEASKLSMGQPLTVMTPHQVQGVLETKERQWIKGE